MKIKSCIDCNGYDDVVAGVLVGLALLAVGVVLFIRGRKNK